MKNALTILACFAFCFASCEKFENEINIATATVDQNILVTTNINNNLLLKLVNDQRTAGCNCGLTVMAPVPALSWNNLLAAAAAAHCKDMNTHNFFSHTSSNGNTVTDRVNAVGYKWFALGENIASGQFDEQTVFSAWLKSEGHCKNLMSASFKEMGAAKEGKYWGQNFGAR